MGDMDGTSFVPENMRVAATPEFKALRKAIHEAVGDYDRTLVHPTSKQHDRITDAVMDVLADLLSPADPFGSGHGLHCWSRSGGRCDCTAKDAEYFTLRKPAKKRRRQFGSDGRDSRPEAAT